MKLNWLILLAVLLLSPIQLSAHEVRPGYLHLKQVEEETFDVLWRVRARGEKRMTLYARLPAHCVDPGEVRAWRQNAAHIERWLSRCPGGLTGHSIRIDGLSATLTDVCLLYTSPSPRDRTRSRMPSSA